MRTNICVAMFSCQLVLGIITAEYVSVLCNYWPCVSDNYTPTVYTRAWAVTRDLITHKLTPRIIITEISITRVNKASYI